ncbi:MAG: CatA-like O-acetyltransferase [Balneolaceae bacterium]|jgi:chloramphenicol O-acetyltransferase type A
MRYLDTENWHRKEQYYFFKDFDNPFFNVCTELELGPFIKHIDTFGYSFSMVLLFVSLKAANETEPLCYRLEDEKVTVYDRIDVGQTILNDDNSFSFCYFKYNPSFEAFYNHSQQVLQRHHQGRNGLDPRENQKNLVHCSTLPWFKFTSFSHARNYDTDDSIPKFVFGKYFNDASAIKIPFSIEVHHALMDGIHVAEYLERFQNLLLEPKKTLSL